eukprot:gene15148-17920_t
MAMTRPRFTVNANQNAHSIARVYMSSHSSMSPSGGSYSSLTILMSSDPKPARKESGVGAAGMGMRANEMPEALVGCATSTLLWKSMVTTLPQAVETTASVASCLVNRSVLAL